MFKVKVKDEIIQHCQKQVDTYNFGRRYTDNGTKEQQLTGIIGQCVVMEMFGQGYIDGSTGCDGGTDISVMGCSIDVKTMGRSSEVRYDYVSNYMAIQKQFNTDLFIFCSYHKVKRELTICGWISKADLLKRATLYPKGTIRYRSDGTSFPTYADLYEIRNDKLNDVNSPEMLKREIEYWYQNK